MPWYRESQPKHLLTVVVIEERLLLLLLPLEVRVLLDEVLIPSVFAVTEDDDEGIEVELLVAVLVSVREAQSCG